MIGNEMYIDSLNKHFVAVEGDHSCVGCAFSSEGNFNQFCTGIYHSNNYCRGIIWIKQQPVETQATTCNKLKGEPEMNTASKATKVTTEEPKYTLAEFLEAYDNWYGSEDEITRRDAYFQKVLGRKNNPEYQEYLRLKAKFD